MRILIAVATCWENKNTKIPVIKETWLRHVQQSFPDGEHQIDVKFFYGAAKSPGRPALDEVFLPCPDDYRGLTYKVRSMCRWARKRDLWDYVLKTDDDTYVSPELIKAVTNATADYVGHCFPLEDDGHFAAGGAYLLSRRAVSILADAAIAEAAGRVIAEDQFAACQLHANGIDAVHDSRFSGHLRGCEELAGKPVQPARHLPSSDRTG